MLPSAFLTSCGSNPPPASNLTGVWQLAGDPVASPKLAVSVVLIGQGSQLAGTGVVTEQCSGSPAAVTLGFKLNGSVDQSSSGFFNVASQPTGVNQNVFNLRGQVPKAAGQPWTGTYSLYVPDIACDTQPTSDFTAAAIAAPSGTFAGSITSAGLSGVATPPGSVSVSVQLTPSTTLTASGYTPAGSIAVTGSPCFKSGTLDAQQAGQGITADSLVAYFKMDDGSEAEFFGLTNASGASINGGLSVSGGACDLAGGLGVLSKQ